MRLSSIPLTLSTLKLRIKPFQLGSCRSRSKLPVNAILHVIEHVGLGRYGDKIDYDGDTKAIGELKRVLAPGGFLLFVVPIGEFPMIRYNAHRIYALSQIFNFFADYRMRNFAFIFEHPDPKTIINPEPSLLKGQQYACGCFCLQKPK